MRYAKLGLAVLLTIGGAIVTFGGVAGAFFFFHHCVGVASGSLEAAYCHENHVAPVAVAWLAGGLMLDAAAIAAIRFRGTPWVAHRHTSSTETTR